MKNQDNNENRIDDNRSSVSSIESRELKRKKRFKFIKRSFLIILNAFLGCYLIFSVSEGIIDYFQKTSFNVDEEIISVNGLSKDESLKVYHNVIDKDENNNFKVTEAIDYFYYGGYLHFKSSTDELNDDNSLCFSDFNHYVLRNLSTSSMYDSSLDFKNPTDCINNGIPLFSNKLKKGDYIIYPYAYNGSSIKYMEPLKIDSEKGICDVFYTPIINNQRKKITLKSKTSSPCLILSVQIVPSLEKGRCDYAVLIDKNDVEIKNKVSEMLNTMQVNFVSKSKFERENVVNLFKQNSLINLIIDDSNDIMVSHYLKIDGTIVDEIILNGYLKGYDSNVYIRELGGRNFKAGFGYSLNEKDENKYLSPYVSSDNHGSLTIIVGKTRINDLETILNSLNVL